MVCTEGFGIRLVDEHTEAFEFGTRVTDVRDVLDGRAAGRCIRLDAQRLVAVFMKKEKAQNGARQDVSFL